MKLFKRVVALVLALGLFLTPATSTLIPMSKSLAEGERVASEVNTTIKQVHPKYGNSILNIQPKVLYDAGYKIGDIVTLEVNGHKLDMPFVTNYSDVDHGSLVMIDTPNRDNPDVHELIAAINLGNIAKKYGIKNSDPVKITLKEAGAYLEEYEIRHLERTNNREDYKSDEVFANFRPITTSGLKKGILYRSSNPINNEIGRATYADALISKTPALYPGGQGVQTVINLADTPEQIKGYAEKADFNSPYYKGLFDRGSVIALSMGIDFSEEAFAGKLAEGLRFLIKNNGPYLVHCTEGKDRAGFVSALLSSLMGASLDEVVNDYMTTYENYYHIEKDSSKWSKIAYSNIKLTLKTVVAGLDKDADLSKVDLAKAAEGYLKRIGLNDSEINRLKICLAEESGTVNNIEKYGHAMSDIKVKDLKKAGYNFGDLVTIEFDNGFKMDMPYVDGYFVEKGAYLLRAYPGDETVAVCINYGKFNEKANVVVGDRFKISLKEKAGFMDEYLKRHLVRTNDRNDYSSDEVFANFRNIQFGKTAPERLYRSSSPIDNKYNRASFADMLMGKAKVKTIVNLSDTDEKIKELLAKDDFNSPNYKKAFEEGRVISLNLGLAYESPEFKAGIIEGLKFMAKNEGPYLFHCIEGKDRTGFMAAILNSLMGASLDEITEDYMKSFTNFYGVSKEKNEKQYNLIKEDIIGMLKHITQSSDLSKTDLKSKTQDYLLSGGMTQEEIDKLIANLSHVEKENSKPAEENKPEKLMILKGKDSKWRKGDKLPIIICNGDLDKLTAVLFDGKEVSSKDMILSKGSTKLSFTKDFLSKIKPGVHKVTLVYGEDSISTTLTILGDKQIAGRKKPSNNVKTGDPTSLAIYAGLILASSGILLISKKKEKENK